MIVSLREKRLWVLFFLLSIISTASQCGAAQNTETLGKTIPRRIMAFYYPWYGTADGPGGAGRTVHWGSIDADNKDIAASTNYPELGAYDSHDPEVINKHCQWAKDAGIDTFIVSWWGHNHYTDRAMGKILDGCQRNGLKACIYYETVPKPRTPQSAADDIVKALNKYGEHPAHLRVNGKPVVFVYGRAVQELDLTGWLKAIDIINKEYKKGIVAIGDKFSYGAARVFGGLHTYNTAGHLRDMEPVDASTWADGTYRSWVQLADQAGKISTITVIPGYDDTKIRKPGLAVNRYGGELYRVQWEQAMKADPHWILITSFNEWHEGSEIEPSLQNKQKYLELTARYAKDFKAKNRIVARQVATSGFSIAQKAQLRQKLERLRIGVLPGPDSMGFWWLLDIGVNMEVLTWENVVKGNLTPQRYPILLYCAGERYRRSVQKSGDVDDALVGYLKEGGCLMVLPSMPWPFYSDENGKVVNRSSRFGLTLRKGLERPPGDTALHFRQPQSNLAHVPQKFPFPTSGDLRWRPFFAGGDIEHTSLLQLRDGSGRNLGDAVAYAKLDSGGTILYVWFGLLDGPYAEPVLYDVYDFITTRINP